MADQSIRQRLAAVLLWMSSVTLANGLNVGRSFQHRPMFILPEKPVRYLPFGQTNSPDISIRFSRTWGRLHFSNEEDWRDRYRFIGVLADFGMKSVFENLGVTRELYSQEEGRYPGVAARIICLHSRLTRHCLWSDCQDEPQQ